MNNFQIPASTTPSPSHLYHVHQYFIFRCFEEMEGILILILWYSSLAAHRFLCYWGSDGRGGRDIDGAATEGWTDSIDFSGNYFDKIIVSFFYEYKAHLICLPFQYFNAQNCWQILSFTEYGLIEKWKGTTKRVPEFLFRPMGNQEPILDYTFYIFGQHVLSLT